MLKYTSGNKWLRWDLHLHDPSSVLNNQYGDKNKEDVWEKFIANIEKSDIDVLGITNYYSISGYKKVMEYKNKGRLKNIKAIFPNVEVRLSVGADENRFINYHIIFDPEVADYIEPLFLSKLSFQCGNNRYNCTKNEMIQLGKGFEEKSDEEAYRKGITLFKANVEEIDSTLRNNQKFNGKYFRIVAGDNSDGVNTLVKDSQGWGVRKDILFKSDALFTTSQRTIDYFRGNGNSKEREYLFKYLGGPRPCFQGSDAHGFNGEFNKKWTWIKAEPSFNGLLQTKFEPERRVEESRYLSKIPLKISGNQWIRSIRIDDFDTADNSGKKTFQKNIDFNPGLNVIIGGKSSGKSILLYEIARTAGKTNFKKINSVGEYSLTDYSGLNIKTNLFLGDQTELKDEFRVNYFPQLFINSISENYRNSELQNIIRNSLNNNDNISYSIDKFEGLKHDLNTNLKLEIENYTNLLTNLDDSKEKISKIGKISYLNDNLRNKKGEYSSLKSELNLTKKEETEFSSYQEESKNLKNEKQDYLEERAKFELEKTNLLDLINEIRKTYQNADINDEIKKNLNSAYKSFDEALIRELDKIKKEISKREDYIKNDDVKLENLSKKIKPILDKQYRANELNQCKEEIEQLEKNISILKQENKKIEKYQNELEKNLDVIREKINTFIEDAIKIANNLTGKEVTDGLTLKTNLEFNQENYENRIIEKFDKRTLRSSESFGLPLHLTIESFSKKWIELIKRSLNHGFDSKLKGSVEPTELLNSLTDIPIYMPINLNKENDDLSIMSPGKRAIVVLELLLEGDPDDKSPILIDQPEDNLDNRSISRELVGLLRKVSLNRQVFIVTHNANLVVLADADEVIVANQDPEISENEEFRFEYITGSLENSTGFDDNDTKLASKGIRDDVTDILEGGLEAFKIRERKYLLN